ASAPPPPPPTHITLTGPPAPRPGGMAPNATMIQPKSELPSHDRGRGHRGHRAWRLQWLVVGGLALVMVVGIVLTGWYFSQGRYTTVPNLLGKNIGAATTEAEKLGFKVTVAKAENSDKVGEDKVLRTDPAYGSEVIKGSALTLVPSAGPVTIPVPNVAGLDEASARSKIAEVGLTVGKVGHVASDSVESGKVIRTSPQIGSRVRERGKVNIVMSNGPAMPDVNGMPRDQAEQVLRGKGLNPQFVEQIDDAPPGTVIAQDPGPGDPITRGAAVQITIAKAGDMVCLGNICAGGGPDQAQQTVPVPDERFKNVRDAREELQRAGFKVTVRKVTNSDRVIGQTPLGQAPPGSEITIWH
ncbi:MAG TPA: PASTA domain-containing protein, partial [Thermopolyspora sp.]